MAAANLNQKQPIGLDRNQIDSNFRDNDESLIEDFEENPMSREGNRAHHHRHHHHHHHHSHQDYDDEPTVGYEALNLTIRRHPPNALDPVAHHLTSNHPKKTYHHNPVTVPLIQQDIQVLVKPTSPSNEFQQSDKSTSQGSRVQFYPTTTVIPDSTTFIREPPPNIITTTPNVQIYVSNTPPENKSRRHSSAQTTPKSESFDPDDRPIRPMKNVNVYNPTQHEPAPVSVSVEPPASRRKIVRPPKLVTPRKPPVQNPSPPPVSPIRIDISSNRSLPPSRQTRNTAPRRPIRLDIIPKKVPVFIEKTPKEKPTRVIIEEEYEEDEPEVIIEDEPEIIEYRVVPSIRKPLRHVPHRARIVHVEEPPVRRIIYRS